MDNILLDLNFKKRLIDDGVENGCT